MVTSLVGASLAGPAFWTEVVLQAVVAPFSRVVVVLFSQVALEQAQASSPLALLRLLVLGEGLSCGVLQDFDPLPLYRLSPFVFGVCVRKY